MNLSKRFRTRKIIIDEEVTFNGYVIRQESIGNTTLDMRRYLKHIKPLVVGKERHMRGTD